MSDIETVTSPFTDLVGSTALASRVGPNEAEDLRLEHFALLREAIAAANGREVKNLGDGLMVAFDSVTAAVGAAVKMQQAIDRHNRHGVAEPLAIRVGLSVGESAREGSDYFGTPVVEAARLCAAAEGGQILTT